MSGVLAIAPCWRGVKAGLQWMQPHSGEGVKVQAQELQSKVGPLVGLLLGGRGWLPMVLAWGPWVLGESSAGAERW